MKESILDRIIDNPIISAVNEEIEIQRAAESKSDIVFILKGDICNIADQIKFLKDKGKIVFVYLDLIDGLNTSTVSIDYLKNQTEIDGIISSKIPMIRHANEQGIFTIHRFFLLDSKAYRSLPKQYSMSKADIVEIVPGSMPKVIAWVKEQIGDTPLIASGLVCDKDDVISGLSNGAIALSSTNQTVWNHI